MRRNIEKVNISPAHNIFIPFCLFVYVSLSQFPLFMFMTLNIIHVHVHVLMIHVHVLMIHVHVLMIHDT